MAWPIQDASERFEQVVENAMTDGPQEITAQGQRVAVVLSVEDYDRLAARPPSFVEHLLSGPAWDDELVEAINDRPNWSSRPGGKP